MAWASRSRRALASRLTELWRKIVNDGMDVLGGAAISRGPRNLLAHGYVGTPICITVEGANILTRTLMIFGQGAIRCHPYAFNEIDALTNNDLRSFDKNFDIALLEVGVIETGIISDEVT